MPISFRMFDVPFRHGGALERGATTQAAPMSWSSHANSTTRCSAARTRRQNMNLDNHDYRVVGVLDRWQPIPKFYDLNNDKYGKSEELYLPFTRPSTGKCRVGATTIARAISVEPGGKAACIPNASGCNSGRSCPPRRTSTHYRAFLNNYAADQRRSGRFTWPPHTRIRDVREWLVYQHAVSDEVRILVLVSFQLPVGLPAQCHGTDAGENHGTQPATSACGARWGQPARDFRPMPDRGRRHRIGGRPARAGARRCWVLMGLRSLLSEEVSRLTHFSPADIAIAVIAGGHRDHARRAVSHLARRAGSAGLATQSSDRGTHSWNFVPFFRPCAAIKSAPS